MIPLPARQTDRPRPWLSGGGSYRRYDAEVFEIALGRTRARKQGSLRYRAFAAGYAISPIIDDAEVVWFVRFHHVPIHVRVGCLR